MMRMKKENVWSCELLDRETRNKEEWQKKKKKKGFKKKKIIINKHYHFII